MLEVSARIGVCPLTFWQLTPGELSILVTAFNQRMKDEHDEKLVVAYLTAYWKRVKKMPSIKEIIKQEKKEQTAEDMLDMIKRLNAEMGGTVY